MRRLFSATVAIMILLWSASTLTITAHASTGLVVKRYRTDLVKGEVPEEFIVDDESFNIPIVDEDPAEPGEPIEEIDLDVGEEEIIPDDIEVAEATEDDGFPLATPTDIDEVLITEDSPVDIHTEEEIEEVEDETEVQIP